MPVGVAGLVLVGTADRLALGYAVGRGGRPAVAYCAVFLLLAVLTGNAVVVGLLYALIWETTVLRFVPGARALSIRQWASSVGETMLGPDAARFGVSSEVALPVGHRPPGRHDSRRDLVGDPSAARAVAQQPPSSPPWVTPRRPRDR